MGSIEVQQLIGCGHARRGRLAAAFHGRVGTHSDAWDSMSLKTCGLEGALTGEKLDLLLERQPADKDVNINVSQSGLDGHLGVTSGCEFV